MLWASNPLRKVPHDWKSLLFFMKISLQRRNGGVAVSDQSDTSGRA
jgi:hypothetical protein